MQRKCATIASMKTATIPSIRVEPELREEVESLLREGETVSEFVEASVRATVLRKRHQAEFAMPRPSWSVCSTSFSSGNSAAPVGASNSPNKHLQPFVPVSLP